MAIAHDSEGQRPRVADEPNDHQGIGDREPRFRPDELIAKTARPSAPGAWSLSHVDRSHSPWTTTVQVAGGGDTIPG